jgi:aldehyde dehydrogenase (NAD+)
MEVINPEEKVEGKALYHQVFEQQKAYQYELGNRSAKERIAVLKKLLKAVMSYRPQFKEAMWQDFRKPAVEVDISEVFVVTSEIKHAIRNLKYWMKPKGVQTPTALIGSSSFIHYEPKGVCLIISPWNFPINLTLGPLVSAIAAGNAVMIKPSEYTPHSSAVMKSLIEEVFNPEEVAIFEGDQQVSQELLELPFNHIFFTGSPQVGKIIMSAAAKNLSSVTLELGGKSPTIVDRTANLDEAAAKIMWGKFFNAGQICVSPDYLFVHESVKDGLLNKFVQKLKAFYQDSMASDDYPRIVNQKHFKRLMSIIDDAREKGANLITGGEGEGSQRFISPTIISDVRDDMRLMEEEIFGPVLPVKTFNKLEEVVKYIRKGEKPLALYMYSRSKKNQKYILQNTRAGGTCFNDNVVHFNQNNLPFGGSNNSGIGKSHGFYGFEAFSNPRAVLRQPTRFSMMKFLFPPYNAVKEKLVDITIKYM